MELLVGFSPVPAAAGGPAPVAIGANDIALGDLPLHNRQASHLPQSTDIGAFNSAYMVELQNHDIRLAAVDAWIFPQMANY